MADNRERRSWQAPAYGSDPAKILEWQKQQVEDGIAFLEAEPGYEELDEAIRILSGKPTARLLAKQNDERYSKMNTNRLKRNLREMVNSLSEISFTPGFHSDANETQAQAELLNRVAYSWYVDRMIDLKIKKGVQWMAICMRGWLEPCYRTIPGERFKKEIDVLWHTPFDCVFTGIPDNNDFQEAYTGTIIKDMPVYLAHALFPNDTEDLVPDRETPVGWRERWSAKFKGIIQDIFDPLPSKTTAKNPTCRLYYTYVLDLSINETGQEIKMGYEKDDKGAPVPVSWSYNVPAIGQRIPAGYDSSGTPVFRIAEKKDCRMFHGRRLMISNDRKNLRDGPMFDWHGKIPLIKLTADSWPFGDFSMVHDVAPIHETVNEIDRISHQTVRNRFNPSLLYNLRAMPRHDAKAIRTEVTGQRIGYNGNEGNDPVKPLLPKEFYMIDAWVSDFRKYLTDEEDYQMGVKDVTAMSKMKVGAASDSMEKLMELAGPIVKGISRDMERSMRDLAEMFKFLVMQYYTTPKIMQIVGKDGITPENFDYDPGNLVPSHLPGEDKTKPSIYSRRERAKYAADHVSFMITPGSLHEITQTSQKLLYVQLWRGGFPISPWDLADALRLPNFSKKPEGTNDMLGRWQKWKEMELAQQAKLAAMAQEAGGGAGGGGNAPGLGPGGGQRGTGGRPSSGQSLPRLATRDGGTRSIIKESR